MLSHPLGSLPTSKYRGQLIHSAARLVVHIQQNCISGYVCWQREDCMYVYVYGCVEREIEHDDNARNIEYGIAR